MKYKELKQKGEEELRSQLTELHKELVKLNAQVATGTTLQNPGQLKNTKKTIARIKQILENG